MELISTYLDSIVILDAEHMIPGVAYSFDYGILNDEVVSYIAVCDMQQDCRYSARTLFTVLWRNIEPFRPRISLFNNGISNIKIHYKDI